MDVTLEPASYGGDHGETPFWHPGLQSLPCVVGVFDHVLGLFPEEKKQHLALGF